VNKSFIPTVDILNEKYGLKALFSPEHGLRGHLQACDRVGFYIDERTGIPVYSLYGDIRKPSREMLDDIDMLVVDIQEVGSRYITYIYTMALAMKSCAEQGKAFTVLDRINPIGGGIEGNILDVEFSSFVGLYPLPVRYGLTLGELAMLINYEYGIGAELKIVRAEGWERKMYFDETDLFWINPTPNMPSVEAALLYNGTCLFEGTNISEGRGTTKPFEMIGAPWLDPYSLAAEMNRQGLEGVYFRPAYFSPVFSKHKGEVCGGVQLHITDRNKIEPFKIGVRLLFEIRRMSNGKFSWITPDKEEERYFIDLLAGTNRLRLAGSRQDIENLLEEWSIGCEKYKETIEKYRIYK